MTQRRECRARVARRRNTADAVSIAAVVAAFPGLPGVAAVDHFDAYGDVVFRDAEGRPVAMVRPMPDGTFDHVF